MQPAIQELLEALGAKVVLTGDTIAERPTWMGNGGAGSAPALIRPRNTEQVATALRICHAHGQAIVPQGGLTGLVKATVTNEQTLALSLDRMTAIEAIDVKNRTMTVQAGVPLQRVQEAAEDAGLMFPLDLGARGSATIGGNVATNAGGNRVIRYGMMRENVLGLEAVLADGTVLSSMHPMIKNNTGYDLKQLFIGSEGTLGIVTRVILRLRQQPRSQNVALVGVADFDRVTTLLGRIDAELGGTLSAFEVLWRDFYELVTSAPAKNRRPFDAEAPYYVLIESLGSDQAADEARFEAALIHAFEDDVICDAAIAKSQAERDDLWALRDDVGQVGRNAPVQTFDVSLAIGDIQAYVDEVNEHLAARWPDYTNMVFGHLGDGNVHLIVGVGDASPTVRHAVDEIVYGCLRARGGSVSAEHGIGLEKKAWLQICRSPEEIALMATLKQALDPTLILNPGKVL
ncbi:MAG TPA: FAD-binding oxidoreductase [Pseudomonadales bacterium]|nr:FAD-binding oxidoreductase [Pseudomonadales bacterium]